MVAIAPLDWMGLRDLAWGLALPGTVETDRPQGPCLTAHGQLWTWWDRQTDAPGFRILPVERPFLIAAEPEVFFVTPEIETRHQMFARPDRVSLGWVQGHLLLSWRELAPRSFVEMFPGEGPPVPSYSRF